VKNRSSSVGRRFRGPVLAALIASAAASGCGRDDPEQLWNQAKAEWTAKRYEEAEAALARIARTRLLTLHERLLRAQVARDRGRIDKAVAALGDPPANAPAPEAAVVLSSRGTLELLRHRFRDAEGVLTRALELDPTRDEARRELVNMYALQGRFADLATQARALGASGAGPKDFAEAYLWTVGRREDVGPPELAEALGQAVVADPGDRASRLALADSLRRLGRLDEADQALAPLPQDDLETRARRARVALARGATDEAAALLNAGPDPASTAGTARPRDIAVLSCLRGNVALLRGNTADAVRQFQDAYRLTPDERETLSGLAQALRLAGDTAAARPHGEALSARDRLERLVQNARPPSRRNDPNTLREIGEACQSLSRDDEARAWYRLALARDPLDADLQKRLFHLEPRDAGRPAAPKPERP
jgi:tetratricopeptide (TPR) repeat protein